MIDITFTCPIAGHPKDGTIATSFQTLCHYGVWGCSYIELKDDGWLCFQFDDSILRGFFGS